MLDRAYNDNEQMVGSDILSFLNFCHLLGDFKRRLPRTPSTGTMSSADDLDEREPPSPSDCGNVASIPEFPKGWLLSYSVTLLFNELEKNTLNVL